MIARSVACALLAVVFLAGASCSPGDDDTDGTTSSSSSSSSSSTTLSTEDALRRQVVDLFELRNEIFMNPNPDRVDEFADSRCECYEAERSRLKRLHDSGWRYESRQLQIIGVRLENNEVDGLALFTVVAEADAIDVIDNAAETVDSVPAVDRSGYSVSLVRVGGDWLLQGFEGLLLEPSVLDAISRLGTP